MIYENFAQLIKKVRGCPERKRMAVAAAEDAHTLEAVFHAQKEGIIEPLLVGQRDKIRKILWSMGQDFDDSGIYDCLEDSEAAVLAVQLVRDGRADFLMKGRMDTSVILKAVVDKAHGLGLGRTMSHFTMFEIPAYHKVLVAVDGGMVPYPTLEQKRDIIINTVEAMAAMGYDCPKVGVLACVEKVNPKMPETVEARELREMNRRGEILGCIVEGPISYDCATVGAIAKLKGFESPVAGEADILLVPNIHAGNIMGKALTCTGGARMAGFVVGARCPVVLTSRGSSADEKYMSIVLSAAAAPGRA